MSLISFRDFRGKFVLLSFLLKEFFLQYKMVHSRRKLLYNTVPETIVHHGRQDMATGREDMMSGA